MQPKGTVHWEEFVELHGPDALIDLPNERLLEWGGILFVLT